MKEIIQDDKINQRRLKGLKNRYTTPPPIIENKKEEESKPTPQASQYLEFNLEKENDLMKDDSDLELNLDKDKMEDDTDMYDDKDLSINYDQSKGLNSLSPSSPPRRNNDWTKPYEHEVISIIFKVVLQSSLDGYMTLTRENFPSNHFNLDEIDNFIVAYISALEQQAENPFYHLVLAHSRVEKEYGSVKSRKKFKKGTVAKDYRLRVLDDLREVILNNVIVMLCLPIQKLEATSYRLLIEGLLKDFSISRPFLAQLIEKFSSEEKILKSMMNQFFYAYFEESLKLNIHDPQLETFLLILSFLLDPKQFQTKISSIFVDHPLFLNDRITNGEELENCSLLGQIFNIHATKKVEVGDSIGYMNITRTDRDYLNNKKKALRQSQIKVQLRLKEICLHLAEPAVIRPKLEKWFAAVVQLNDDRTKIIDQGDTSSDGFLLNFMVVSLMLSKPVVNKHDYSMVIPSFPMQTTDIDCLKEVAKIGTTIPNAINYFVGKPVPVFPFQTKMFFFALRSVIIGYTKTREHYIEILEGIKYLKAEKARGVNVFREGKKMLHYILAYESALFDLSTISLLTSHLKYLAKYLLYQAGYTNSIHLAKEVPMEFASLPEEFIELIPRILIFFSHDKLRIIRLQKMDTFLEMMIVFLNNAHYIKNPHVRAKFPEALSIFVRTNRYYKNHQLLNNALSQKHLMFGLMKLYVDEHIAFSQKFAPRYYIAKIIRGVWSIFAFRQQFKELSLTMTSSADRTFLKFLNTIITDSLYLLESSSKILISIHDFEKKVHLNQFNSPRERVVAEQSLDTQRLKGFLLCETEILNMIATLSRSYPEPFINSIMIDRVATILNYLLGILVGKKNHMLIVKTPQRYNFKPKMLMMLVVSIYLNFSHSNPDAFCKSVISDKRFYDEVLFFKGVPLFLTLFPEIRNDWRQFLHHIQRISSLEKDDFEDDDIPSDFEDPITYELMRDPVKLPDGHIVDRRTIEIHLLNYNQNPFTNQLMTMEDVVPQPVLKQQIDEWLFNMRSKK